MSRILNSLWQVFSPFLCVNMKLNYGSTQWQAAIRSNVAEDVPFSYQKNTAVTALSSLLSVFTLHL